MECPHCHAQIPGKPVTCPQCRTKIGSLSLNQHPAAGSPTAQAPRMAQVQQLPRRPQAAPPVPRIAQPVHQAPPPPAQAMPHMPPPVQTAGQIPQPQQLYHQPQASYPPMAVPPMMNSNNGKASVIMGGIGLVAWLLPIIGIPLTIIGLIFGIKNRNTTGIVMNSIALLLSLVNSIAGVLMAS